MLRSARVARPATIGSDGWPHVVPASPVLDGDRLPFRQYEPQAAIVRGVTVMVEVSIDRVSVSGV
jgi:hypothetical protein